MVTTHTTAAAKHIHVQNTLLHVEPVSKIRDKDGSGVTLTAPSCSKNCMAQAVEPPAFFFTTT